jgi:hypothetical protein
MWQAHEVVAHLGESGEPEHRPRKIEDQGRRDDPVLRGHCPIRDLESAGRGFSGDRCHEPGLADPSLACQQEEMAATLTSVGEPSIGQIEQVVASNKQRA